MSKQIVSFSNLPDNIVLSGVYSFKKKYLYPELFSIRSTSTIHLDLLLHINLVSPAKFIECA